MYTSVLETGLDFFYLYKLNSKIIPVANCLINYNGKFDGLETKFSNLFLY